jgi:hypothetical protein
MARRGGKSIGKLEWGLGRYPRQLRQMEHNYRCQPGHSHPDRITNEITYVPPGQLSALPRQSSNVSHLSAAQN